MAHLTEQFKDLDRVADPTPAFRFLDAADAMPTVRAYKGKMNDLLRLVPGESVLDVGCGVGHEVLRLAELVGPSGRVVGLDKAREMLVEARRRADAAGAQVTFVAGDAQQLDLPDASFDACRFERVLLYVDRPEQALAEMVRVLRPGGRLACFEFDYDAMLIDAPDRVLTRQIVHALCDSLPGGSVGRQLPGLLRRLGLGDVTVEPHLLSGPFELFQRIIGGTLEALMQAGALDRAAVTAWLDGLAQRARDGHYFVGFVGVVVSARKPLGVSHPA